MISIEVCWIHGLSDQNLNLAKCIRKLIQAEAFFNSANWIRINPNYIRILDSEKLICKNEENKSFVQLTKKGQSLKVFYDKINMSLDEYFAHEDNIELFIQDSLCLNIGKSSYKIMHNICHSCGNVKTHLNHIVDRKLNDGMYCDQCLNQLGYAKSLENATKKRIEAKNAFSVKKNKVSIIEQ